jgi:tripartite ATP-independent transporter DctM subunit
MEFDIIALSILFGSFFLLLILRIPIAFALIFSSIMTTWYLGIPTTVLFQKMVNGLNSFTFLAVPFFIVGAQIMTEGGISNRLMRFSNLIIGRIRGGTAMVNILTSMFFGGISGSSVADVSSIGSFLIPFMKKQGYDDDYSVAVTVTSSVQGVIIPPSQNMIYYSLAAGGLSISKLFLAGYVPGILLGLVLMLVAYCIAVKRKYPRNSQFAWKEVFSVSTDAILGLVTIVIIIGGVLLGIFTATESAAIATVYALIVTTFVYKEMSIPKFIKILSGGVRTLAVIIAIIATSSAFGFLLAYLKVPTIVTNFFLTISSNPQIILFLMILLLILLGMFMDMGILILLVTPILLPVAVQIGISEIHFGIIMMASLGLGLCTPPVGTSLFVGCTIAGLPIEKSFKGFLPFYIAMIVFILLVAYVPALSMWLPSFVK